MEEKEAAEEGPRAGKGIMDTVHFPVSHFDSPLGRTVSGVIMKK